MDDYIRREDALAVFGDLHPLDYNANACYHKIQKLLSADFRPAVRGRWIKNYNAVNPYDVYVCSICQKGMYFPFKYCPYCGAEMKGEEDGE